VSPTFGEPAFTAVTVNRTHVTVFGAKPTSTA